MMKKAALTMTAIFTAAAMMAGCTSGVSSTAAATENKGSEAASGENASSGSSYKIGVYTKDSTTAFWRYVVQGAMAKGEELGIEVVEYAPASYTDSAGQLSMVEDSISAGVDAICIASCDSTAIVPALEKATAAGIPVVVFNTLVPDFKDNITFVGVDNYDASYRVTEELIKAHDGKGNLVILEGDPAGYQNIERTRAVTDLAEKYPDVNILTSQPGYANREKSMNAMENILQAYSDIDMVWAINDVAAMGCVQAIEGAGRTGIDVIGIDGTPEGATAAKEGRLKFTIDQGPFDQGAMSVQAAVDYLDGKEIQDNYATGGTIVGADNAAAFLQEYYPDFNK